MPGPVRFGLHLCAQRSAADVQRGAFARIVQELTEQVRLAREVGFTAISVPQHYLSNDLPQLQPLPLLARLTAETTAGSQPPMQVATAIQLLGLPNPLDTAEQLATLDVLSGGQLRVGVALGYRDEEFAAFGISGPVRERAARYQANLELVSKLLAGETVSFDQPWCRLDNASLAVPPVQRPRPPLWMGANGDRALKRVARLGDAWLLNAHARLDTLERQFADIYLPELERLGKPRPAVVPIRREFYVAADRRAAYREAGPSLFPKYETYAAWGQDEQLPEDDSFDLASLEELARDRFILGSPEECIAELERCVERVGATDFLLRVQWAGMPQAQALRQIETIGTHIIPHVARAA